MKRFSGTAGLLLSAGIMLCVTCMAEETASYIPASGRANGNSADATGESVVLTLEEPEVKTIEWNPEWPYASFSEIHTGTATLYRAQNSNGITVCVNAGHGTDGGGSVKTLCHPDGSPKVTGGSTPAGATYAVSVSGGTVMLDGSPESAANLQMAMILKDKLLNTGFNVLMIRETSDVQLDNIARAVIANQNADCHLALHYDSSESDKGFFYMSVPDIASYRAMEPVASHWQEHNRLGACLLDGVARAGNHIWSSGVMEMDLTQTSYSTVPSVDVECGDTASDWSYESQERIAEGLRLGIMEYFGVTEGGGAPVENSGSSAANSPEGSGAVSSLSQPYAEGPLAGNIPEMEALTGE